MGPAPPPLPNTCLTHDEVRYFLTLDEDEMASEYAWRKTWRAFVELSQREHLSGQWTWTSERVYECAREARDELMFYRDEIVLYEDELDNYNTKQKHSSNAGNPKDWLDSAITSNTLSAKDWLGGSSPAVNSKEEIPHQTLLNGGTTHDVPTNQHMSTNQQMCNDWDLPQPTEETLGSAAQSAWSRGYNLTGLPECIVPGAHGKKWGIALWCLKCKQYVCMMKKEVDGSYEISEDKGCLHFVAKEFVPGGQNREPEDVGEFTQASSDQAGSSMAGAGASGDSDLDNRFHSNQIHQVLPSNQVVCARRWTRPTDADPLDHHGAVDLPRSTWLSATSSQDQPWPAAAPQSTFLQEISSQESHPGNQVSGQSFSPRGVFQGISSQDSPSGESWAYLPKNSRNDSNMDDVYSGGYIGAPPGLHSAEPKELSFTSRNDDPKPVATGFLRHMKTGGSSGEERNYSSIDEHAFATQTTSAADTGNESWPAYMSSLPSEPPPPPPPLLQSEMSDSHSEDCLRSPFEAPLSEQIYDDGHCPFEALPQCEQSEQHDSKEPSEHLSAAPSLSQRYVGDNLSVSSEPEFFSSLHERDGPSLPNETSPEQVDEYIFAFENVEEGSQDGSADEARGLKDESWTTVTKGRRRGKDAKDAKDQLKDKSKSTKQHLAQLLGNDQTLDTRVECSQPQVQPSSQFAGVSSLPAELCTATATPGSYAAALSHEASSSSSGWAAVVSASAGAPTGGQATRNFLMDILPTIPQNSARSLSLPKEDKVGPEQLVVEDDTMVCVVCTMLINEPVVTTCSHMYCYDCMKDWIQATERKREVAQLDDRKEIPVLKCPTCDLELQKKGDINLLSEDSNGVHGVLLRMYSDTFLYCIHHSSAGGDGTCSWQGKFKDYKKHITESCAGYQHEAEHK